MEEKIDFVVTWVDGNDIEWQKEKIKYQGNVTNDSNSIVRYREWNLLKYWFRGVEKYAPWVNNIYFVTCGHYPEWLNLNNPKLKLVKHTDYIPKKYLPTFSSHTIELNLNRIQGLSEKFVYFNDDMYLTDKVKKEDFFEKNLPVDSFSLGIIAPNAKNELIQHVLLNNMSIVVKEFDKKKNFKKNWRKYLNIKYGFSNLKTLYMLPLPYLTFNESHVCVSLLKSTLNTLWEKEFEILNKTSLNKFRTFEDVNQWVFRYWQLASGNFIPRKFNFGKRFELSNQNKNILESIKNQKYKVICINDSNPDVDFYKTKQELIDAFKKILPEKSSFEKE